MFHSVQIISRVLIVYFLTLPCFYAWHSVLHDHLNKPLGDNDSEIIQATTECSFCILYLNQSSFSEKITSISFKLIGSTELITYASLELVNSTYDYYYLRGPPQN